MPLTKEQVEEIIGTTKDAQKTRKKQKDYYDGRHAILDSPGMNKDGSARVAAVHNLIARAIDSHVGYAFSEPVQIVSKETEAEQAEDETTSEDETGLDLYEELREQNHLDTTDAEHFRTALITDVSYEIFSFDKKVEKDGKTDAKIKITKVPSTECIGVYDGRDELVALIRTVTVPANSYWEGVFVSETRKEVWVHESTVTTVYLDGRSAEMGSDMGPELELKTATAPLVNPEPNETGLLLVVPFAVTDRREPFMGPELISLQNTFNRLMSTHGNSVIEDSKEHWIIKGFRNTAENIVEFWEMMKNNIIFIPNDASATREKTGSSVPEFEFQRDWTRRAIFETAGAADTEHIVGTTGSTSGIALKLAHVPQSERAATLIKFFTRGIRKRIELINALHEMFGRPLIEKITIKIDTRLIVNEEELWAGIGALSEVLAAEDVLLIAVPSIDDPKAAVERKREQDLAELDMAITLKDADPGGINAPVGVQAATRLGKRAGIEGKTASDLSEQFENLESGLSDEDLAQITEKAIASGITEGSN